LEQLPWIYWKNRVFGRFFQEPVSILPFERKKGKTVTRRGENAIRKTL
jgi:hypothetical protein